MCKGSTGRSVQLVNKTSVQATSEVEYTSLNGSRQLTVHVSEIIAVNNTTHATGG